MGKDRHICQDCSQSPDCQLQGRPDLKTPRGLVSSEAIQKHPQLGCFYYLCIDGFHAARDTLNANPDGDLLPFGSDHKPQTRNGRYVAGNGRPDLEYGGIYVMRGMRLRKIRRSVQPKR